MPLLSDMQKGSCSFHKRFFQFAILMHQKVKMILLYSEFLAEEGSDWSMDARNAQLANCMG